MAGKSGKKQIELYRKDQKDDKIIYSVSQIFWRDAVFISVLYKQLYWKVYRENDIIILIKIWGGASE